MLCKQAVHRDVVTIHLQCIEGLVPRVRHTDIVRHLVVGAPKPQVVPDDVRGVDQYHLVCPHLWHGRVSVPANAAEDVVQEARDLGGPALARAPLDQSVAARRPTLDHQAGNAHILQAILYENQRLHVGSLIGLFHRRQAQSQQHSIALPDDNGLCDLVDARCENNVLALSQFGIDDGCRGGTFLRDIHIFEINPLNVVAVPLPTDAPLTDLWTWDHQVILVLTLLEHDVRLLCNALCVFNDGFLGQLTRLGFVHTLATNQDVAPSAMLVCRFVTNLCVPRTILLLASELHTTIDLAVCRKPS
mmetsp:Transcript_17226/g.45983  ORF Transcript_17226/g.45983 Transcript_17226/m.45983 type:complete len:303 (+) Transcript_17226:285-1193(+)